MGVKSRTNIRALVRVRRAVPQRWRTRLAVSYHYQFQGIFSAGRAVLGAVSMVNGRADGRMQGRERGQTRRWLAEEGAGRGSLLEGKEGREGWEGKCNSDLPLSKTLVLHRRTPAPTFSTDRIVQ